MISRDPVALERFCVRWLDRVYGLTYRLLGDRTLAEDVTQEVFLRVHRAAHTLDPERDPGPWIMTIAHNLCRDVWRSGAYRMGRASATLDDPHGVAAVLGGKPDDDPEYELLKRERERLVREALQELPESLRLAVVLHEWGGLGHEEIARRSGIEHAAQRKRYSRALVALAKQLREKLK
ncbi:MAG: RNA polymerase sigma factor [Candidatus Eisenbacteria bacterium]|uniref:RNA polymerase sigma factor n=1 Tax=Eiseniibacteriota bacterium TaxID=2212470 RepID=A0A849SPL9_UNCEI|nr:RNA polymerase sigma factor [Candidatus Eisenbacteria bacterium]